MFMYCKKCGLIKNVKNNETICIACEADLEVVPKEYLSSTGLMFASQSAKAEFETLIKSSLEYDENIALQRENIISQKEKLHKEEVARKVQEYQDTRPQKTCPVCHSASLSKISNLGKVVKVGAFGVLGAGDLGKTWRCDSCGCKF